MRRLLAAMIPLCIVLGSGCDAGDADAQASATVGADASAAGPRALAIDARQKALADYRAAKALYLQKKTEAQSANPGWTEVEAIRSVNDFRRDYIKKRKAYLEATAALKS